MNWQTNDTQKAEVEKACKDQYIGGRLHLNILKSFAPAHFQAKNLTAVRFLTCQKHS